MKLNVFLLISSLLISLCGCSSKTEAKAPALKKGELALSHSRLLVRPEAEAEVRLTNVGSGKVQILEVSVTNDTVELEGDESRTLSPKQEHSIKVSALETGDSTVVIRFDGGEGEQTRRVVVQSRKLRKESCVSNNPCIEAFIDSSGECEHRPKKGRCDDNKPVTEDDRCVDGICIGRAKKDRVFAPGYDTAENARGAMDDLAKNPLVK